MGYIIGNLSKISPYIDDIYICDRICEKVPFPHILHTSKQNDLTLDSSH